MNKKTKGPKNSPNPVQEQNSGKRPRRSQLERRETARSNIINAAIECLVEHGYSGMTVGAVAEGAGVSKGGVQHHFSDKAEIIMAVIHYVYELNKAEMSLPFPPSLNPQELLVEYFDRLCHVFLTPPSRAALEIRAGARGDPEVQSTILPFFKSIDTTSFSILIDLFIDAGLTEPQAQSWRRITMALVRGCVLEQILNYQMEWPTDGIQEFRHQLRNVGQITRGRDTHLTE